MVLGEEDAMNKRAEAKEAQMPFEVEERSAASVSPSSFAKQPIDMHTCIHRWGRQVGEGKRYEAQPPNKVKDEGNEERRHARVKTIVKRHGHSLATAA